MNIPSISPEARMLGMNTLYPESNQSPMMSKMSSATNALINEGKYESQGVGSMNAAIDAYRNVKTTPKRSKNHTIGVLIFFESAIMSYI